MSSKDSATLVKSGKKGGRTIRNNNGSRRSKSGVSNVLGTDSSGNNSVSGSRLSGMSKTDSVRTASGLRESDQRLHDRAPLTGVERKIAKLNAYRSLLKKKIVLKGVPKDIHEEILKEHAAWIESQVLIMLGQESSQTFNPMEVIVLKQMASRVTAKLNNHQNVGNLGPPKKQPTPTRKPTPRRPPPEPVLSESAMNAQPMISRESQFTTQQLVIPKN